MYEQQQDSLTEDRDICHFQLYLARYRKTESLLKLDSYLHVTIYKVLVLLIKERPFLPGLV